MIIIDNGCTDHTISILRKLINEGYKLHIYDESLKAYHQFDIDNKYLNLAIDKFNPDIILPLDADEFIVAEGNPREALEKLDLNAIYYVNWKWYVMDQRDDDSQKFVPLRMGYCLDRAPWDFDGNPATKVILPAKYYRKKNLIMAMGHHKVYNNENVRIEYLSHIKIAHYRVRSESQLIAKTSCYTMRDIATLDNNVETALRTNQMAKISQGEDMQAVSIRSSYGGYDTGTVYDPIDLSFCDHKTVEMRYSKLADIPLSVLSYRTGCEMAIKYYNCERRRREKKFLKPILLWMDGIKEKEYILPAPSRHVTFITARTNVRAYLTDVEEIRFLKANYRLIITSEWAKFFPHAYIVIPDTCSLEEVKRLLVSRGLEGDRIISWKDYLKHLNILQRVWCEIGLFPGLLERVYGHAKRNGFKNTVEKVKKQL